ncbi:hypothetical protein REPUB_Repub14bG0159300 [Reevesia pubescens]
MEEEDGGEILDEGEMVKNLDEMKKRLKEMEDEIAALREMQSKVEKKVGATVQANMHHQQSASRSQRTPRPRQEPAPSPAGQLPVPIPAGSSQPRSKFPSQRPPRPRQEPAPSPAGQLPVPIPAGSSQPRSKFPFSSQTRHIHVFNQKRGLCPTIKSRSIPGSVSASVKKQIGSQVKVPENKADIKASAVEDNHAEPTPNINSNDENESPPISVRLQEISKNLKLLCSSTPSCVEIPVNDKSEVADADCSPWTAFTAQSFRMKSSVVDEYIRFLNTADKELERRELITFLNFGKNLQNLLRILMI